LVQQVPLSEENFHKVMTSQSIMDLQIQSNRLDLEAMKCLSTWQQLIKYYMENTVITSTEFFESISLFVRHFKNYQVEHLSKSPQASYDIRTSEMMESMRQGELAENRRTLRRNNKPAGSRWISSVGGDSSCDDFGGE
jgi:hypothetical protein